MTKTPAIAKISKSGNDLSWEYWCNICMDSDIKRWSACSKRRVSWNGYDDQYWWDKVSKTDQATIRTTSCGIKLKIEHGGYVSEVVEIVPDACSCLVTDEEVEMEKELSQITLDPGDC